MNGSPVDATNTEVPVVAVEANSDEYITEGAKVSKINESRDETEIDIEEERKTEAYKVTLYIDIENTVKIENIHNHHNIHWRTIYKFIQQELFNETDIHPGIFFKHCKDN